MFMKKMDRHFLKKRGSTNSNMIQITEAFFSIKITFPLICELPHRCVWESSQRANAKSCINGKFILHANTSKKPRDFRKVFHGVIQTLCLVSKHDKWLAAPLSHHVLINICRSTVCAPHNPMQLYWYIWWLHPFFKVRKWSRSRKYGMAKTKKGKWLVLCGALRDTGQGLPVA